MLQVILDSTAAYQADRVTVPAQVFEGLDLSDVPAGLSIEPHDGDLVDYYAGKTLVGRQVPT